MFFSLSFDMLSLLYCGGALLAEPQSAADESKSTKTWSAWGGKVADLSKEKGQEPSPLLNGLLLGSICIGIQVKLINHCQAVRIKQ